MSQMDKGIASSRVHRPGSRRRSPFVAEIFWPHTMLDLTEHAFLIGWNLDNFNCCIVNVIPLSAECYDLLNDALQQVLASKPPGLPGSKSNTSPVILGEWFPGGVEESSLPEVRHQERGIWVTLTAAAFDKESAAAGGAAGTPIRRPELISLYSCSCRYSISCYLFRYNATAPERHYYLTINLSRDFGFISPVDSLIADGRGDHVRPTASTFLECVVEQINCSGYLRHLIGEALVRASDLGEGGIVSPRRVRRVWSALLWLVIRISFMWYNFSKWSAEAIAWVSSVTTAALFGYFFTTHDLGSGDWNRDVGKENRLLFSVNHLRNKFVAVQSSFHVYLLVAGNHSFTPVERMSHWIFLWSYILRTIIDVVCGCILGVLIMRYNREIMARVFSYSLWCQNTVLVRCIQWFDSSPGGLKLNPTLTSHIGDILNVVILMFGEMVTTFSGIYKHVLFMLADVGVFGFTMQLTVIVDVLRIATIHVNAIQLVFSLLHKLQVSVLTSMWLLFTGRKKNVLRKRIDTGEYSQSQVVLGTTFFAISFFLFPTFFIYYAAFTFAQLIVVSICSFLLFVVNFLQAFPICHLVLHYWYPESLVKGIQISFDESQRGSISISTTSTGPSASVTRRRGSSGSVPPSASSSAFPRYPTTPLALSKESEYYFSSQTAPKDFAASKGILKTAASKGCSPDQKNYRIRLATAEKESDGQGLKVLKFADSFNTPAIDMFSEDCDSLEDVAEGGDEESPAMTKSNLEEGGGGRSHPSIDSAERMAESESDMSSLRIVGSIGKSTSLSLTSNASDDGSDFAGEAAKYRPLNEYSFSDVHTEEPSDSDHGRDDAVLKGKPILALTHSVNQDAGTYSSPRDPTSPVIQRGKSRMVSSAGKAAMGNKSVHLNILPKKTGVSTILSNFIHLWNNKVNRDLFKICAKELMLGLFYGSISLNMRSLNIVKNYGAYQLKNRYAYTDSIGESNLRTSNRDHIQNNIAIDGDIVCSTGGDTLIDYFQGNSVSVMRFASQNNLSGDVGSREPSDSDTAQPETSKEWSRFDRYEDIHNPRGATGKLSESSPDDATGDDVSVSATTYLDRSRHLEGLNKMSAGSDIQNVTTGDWSVINPTVSPFSYNKNLWGDLTLSARINDFWKSLHEDSYIEIGHTDIVSSTFRIPDLFLALFWMQSIEFLFLAIGFFLLWADVIFLCFPELMPTWYLNLFFKAFVHPN